MLIAPAESAASPQGTVAGLPLVASHHRSRSPAVPDRDRSRCCGGRPYGSEADIVVAVLANRWGRGSRSGDLIGDASDSLIGRHAAGCSPTR